MIISQSIGIFSLAGILLAKLTINGISKSLSSFSKIFEIKETLGNRMIIQLVVKLFPLGMIFGHF